MRDGNLFKKRQQSRACDPKWWLNFHVRLSWMERNLRFRMDDGKTEYGCHFYSFNIKSQSNHINLSLSQVSVNRLNSFLLAHLTSFLHLLLFFLLVLCSMCECQQDSTLNKTFLLRLLIKFKGTPPH